jgi:hypothetical protein
MSTEPVYSVPANPSVYQLSAISGLFSPPAEPIERRAAPTDAEIDALTARALRQALEAVFVSLGTALMQGPYGA